MKVLRILGLIFTKLVLVVSMILFMASLSTSFVLENGISSLLISGLPNIGESVSHREMPNTEELQELDLDAIYNQVLGDLGITEDQLLKILESDVAKDLVNEFVDTVLDDIATGDASEFDVGEKVMEFVTDNQSEIESLIEQPLPMDKIEEFAQSDEVNKFNEQYKDVINTVSNNVPTSFKGTIKAVDTFISKMFRQICLLVSVCSLFLTALLQWSLYKWIRTLGNTMLGVGIFMLIVSLFGNIFSSVIVGLLNIGGTLTFGKAILSAVICTGIGIVLLIVYVIIKKCVEKKDNKDEVVHVVSE